MSPSRRTYLDWNATAPLREEARAAMLAVLAGCGNASSVHAEGRAARAVIEAAREKVAALVGADPANVIFTSGGTEANVTALSPLNAGGDAPQLCLVSAIEHPSVLAGGRFAPEALQQVRVDGNGVIDLDDLQRQLAEARRGRPSAGIMVSVMVANNETGALQPVAEAARIAHEHGAIVHADAVQAAGRVAIDMTALGADLLSLSAHKLGGPQGAGALVLREPGVLKAPLLTGGGQELRQRAGTENVAAIVGFGVVAELAGREIGRAPHMAALRDRLEAELLRAAPQAVVFARAVRRLPNTSCFAVPGMKAETVVIGLDLAGVAVSAGSACSSGRVEPSHVLAAMGVAPSLARCAIRVSLGWATAEEDIEHFLAAWSTLRERMHRAAA